MLCILGACILAAQLTSGGLYHEDTPKTSVDSFGTSHDISRFYEVDNTQFNVGGYIILDTDTRIDLQYDNGLKSEKRNRGKSLTLGITQLKVIDEDSHITFGLSTRLGGKTFNIPCRATGSPDSQTWNCDNLSHPGAFYQPENKRDYKTSFTYNKSFNWFLGTKETIGAK